MTILLIDNYDSFTYNLYQYVQELANTPVTVARNDALTLEDIFNLKPSHVILSPGPGHPGIASDFGICADIIKELDCPILGVCLGHQGIAHHLGGQVIQAPEIKHGKTSQILIIESSPLFTGITNPFTAMRYHSLVVSEENLPDQLLVTARDTQQDLIMALQHKTRPLYGIQFHPESIGTPEGKKILENFLTQC
jgi:anthranilate synthase/aminodeoxychorismate synthase-like glutamine amidotransferase